MSRKALAIALFAAAGMAMGQTPPGQIGLEERAVYHVKSIAGPGAIGTLFKAGIAQWQDSPREWGQGMEGYGRRYGYFTLDRATQNAILFGSGAILKEDPRYFPAKEKSLGRRVRHAILSTFLVPKAGGGEKLYVSRFAAAYGGAFIANLYYPASRNTAGDAAVRGTITLGGGVTSNLLAEFWPDIRKRIFRKRR